jgi:hypothetical protein
LRGGWSRPGGNGCGNWSAPGTGDGHALAGALADQGGLKLGDDGEDLQEHPGHRVVPVVDRAAEGEPHATAGELGEEGQGVGAERARRSSLVTVKVSPSRTAARAWSRPGRARLVPVSPLSR